MERIITRFALVYLTFFSSISTFAQSPGGVSNPRIWLKSNAGVITVSGAVSQWNDQSTNASDATQATATKRPGYTAASSAFNGYPSLNFDLVDDGMTLAGNLAATPYSFFVVYNSTTTSTAARRAVQGSNNWLIGPYTGLPRTYDGAFVDPGTAAFNGTTPIISGLTASSASTQNSFAYLNGKQLTATGVTGTTAPNIVSLGASGASADPMGGSIAEVIAYTAVVTPAQKNQIESYLALKYGLTLDQTVATDYVNSAGAVIFNAGSGGTQAGYASDVAGILVDNGSGLSQSSSQSVNTGAMLSIYNPSAALSNGEYIIAGDNAAAVGTGRSTDVPPGYGSRIQRVWRVSKAATAATVSLKFYVGDIPEFVTATPSLSNVAILTSPSTTFSGAASYAASAFTGPYHDTLVIDNVTLNNNDYFTLSIGANVVPSTTDFEFWFGVPQWSPSYYTPQRLHLTGAAPANYTYYTIDQPADPTFTPITGTIAPGSAKIIDLSAFATNNTSTDKIMTMPGNTVVNRGLHITVKGQMGAYYTNENQANYASFPLRGPNALGTSFYVPGQPLYANGAYAAPSTSEAIVTATQNNTTVTITPSEAIVGHVANIPFTITLNKGQSYQAQNLSKNGKHLAGSVITATNPVVVTYSDDLLGVPQPSPVAADNAGDQLVPVSRYGNDYVHIRTTLTSLEPLFLVASQNNTTVTIFDGTTTRTRVINAGGLDSVSLRSGQNVEYVHSDKPIMAYQIGGSGYEVGSGVLTPAVNCKGTNLIAFQYPPAAQQTNFNFVVPSGIEGNFVINGSSSVITASDFSNVPGYSGWKWCRKAVTGTFTPGQTIIIQNTAGKFFFYQNMLTVGGGDFSNFSDFGSMVLFPKVLRPSCAGQAVTLDGGVIAYNATVSSYSWSGPNGFSSSTATPTINSPVAADSGWHVLTVTDNFGCAYRDSVLVSVPLSTLTLTPTPSAACVGSTVHFTSTVLPGVAVDSIKWTGPNGFTSTQASFDLSNITTAAAGTYTATYYDKYGCPKTDSTAITVSPSIIADITIAGMPKVGCTNSPVTLSAAGYVAGLNYQTYNPYNAATLYASSNFTTVGNGFYNLMPAASGTATQPDLSALTGINTSSASYGVQYDGFIKITTAGSYTFYTNSKDGSILLIDGTPAVTNDGVHAATEVASAPITLAAGYHTFSCYYYNSASGTAALSVSYAGPSIAKQAIPAAVLFHAGGTAPGGLTYSWSNGANGNSITVTAPGSYTLTGSNGGCTSSTSYSVTSAPSYDYGDLPTTWPVAQAGITACDANNDGVPDGSNGAVWAGPGVSYENVPYSSPSAGADTYDDGLGLPSGSVVAGTNNVYVVRLNSNVNGTTVYYGLWFDWNDNGNFADDVDGSGNPAFYSGSGITSGLITLSTVVNVPASISGTYKARLIASNTPVNFADFGNVFSNGEVEDYQAPISPLALVFTSMGAIVSNCRVTVSFETQSESENGKYAIERSNDGSNWHTIATLNAKGGGHTNDYSFIDAAPIQGRSYYRINRTDPGVSHLFSTTSSVTVNCLSKAEIKVYPNPASLNFTVVIPEGFENAEIELYNQLGQRLAPAITADGNNRVVNTANLPSGIYMLRIVNAKLPVFTKSIAIAATNE